MAGAGQTVGHLQRSPGAERLALEDAYAYWCKSPGYGHPLMNGLQVDEFLPGISAAGRRMPWMASRAWPPIRPSAAGSGSPSSPDWQAGRTVARWPLPMDPFGKQVIQATLKAGWPFSIEFYLPEQPTEADNLAQLRKHLVSEGQHYEQAVPGCLQRAIFTPMYCSIPSCLTNTCPTANFRIHLDMQMEILGQRAGLCGALRHPVLPLALRRSRHAALFGPAVAALLHRRAQRPLFPRPVRIEALAEPGF